MLSYNNAYELSPFKQVMYHFGYRFRLYLMLSWIILLSSLSPFASYGLCFIIQFFGVFFTDYLILV
jgi:hypothetical protein